MKCIQYRLLVFLSLINLFAFASVPEVINFSTKDYKSHSINYGFAEDSSGVMYIANAYCVLEYDGSSFRKIPLINGKSALSLASDKNGRVYVGSSSEFGYLAKDESQNTVYKSLKHKIPGNSEFDQIYKTISHEGSIYFATIHNLYKCTGDSIERIKGDIKANALSNFSKTNNELLYWETNKGLGSIKNNSASIFIPTSEGYSVNAIQWINNEYVLFGNFGIQSARHSDRFQEANAIIKDAIVTTIIPTSANEYLIGTVKNGLYVMNNKGKILRHLTVEHGLQDNYIQNLHQDRSGNIWIAYNNGIGILKWNSPIQYINNAQGFDGMGYAGAVQNDNLYIGTSIGLYQMKQWENGLNRIDDFSLVPNFPQINVNAIKVANGNLVVCTSHEAYQKVDSEFELLSPNDTLGALTWKNANRFNKNEAFIGRYEGISRYEFKNGKWIFNNHIKGFGEYSRVMEIDNKGVAWVVQGNRGLFRVQLNAQRDSAISVSNYSKRYNHSPDYFNDIFYKNDTLYVTTFGGVYYLKGDSLVIDPSFSDVKKYVERARKFDEEGIYGIYNDQAYLLEKRNNKWAIKNSPVSYLRSNLVGSAEFFQKIAPGKYLIGVQDGFALYEPSKEKEALKTKCLIRGIELLGEKKDSLLYNGQPSSSLILPYEHNNVRLTFTIPAFSAMNQIVYETQLLRGNQQQTNWQSVKDVNFREYTNLKEGDYSFTVQAKQGESIIGQQTFEFSVLPPWYRTNLANGFYFVLAILFAMYIKKRFAKQAEILKAEKERELEIKEKLHKAESLEVELKNKENELAYMALSYTQKKEMLASVMGKLDSLSKELEHGERNKVNSLKRSISTNMDDESNWDNFQVHFDQKNDNFFQKLKEVDPKLSESYLLFCSYVRMGKSNKEIAELLNVSVAAVEKRKYRLKKKWELQDDTSFTDYLKSL